MELLKHHTICLPHPNIQTSYSISTSYNMFGVKRKPWSAERIAGPQKIPVWKDSRKHQTFRWFHRCLIFALLLQFLRHGWDDYWPGDQLRRDCGWMTHQSTTAYPEFTMKKQIVSELRWFAWHKSCHTATSGISAYSRSILNIEKSQLCDLINTGGTKTIRRYQEMTPNVLICWIHTATGLANSNCTWHLKTSSAAVFHWNCCNYKN